MIFFHLVSFLNRYLLLLLLLYKCVAGAAAIEQALLSFILLRCIPLPDLQCTDTTYMCELLKCRVEINNRNKAKTSSRRPPSHSKIQADKHIFMDIATLHMVSLSASSTDLSTGLHGLSHQIDTYYSSHLNTRHINDICRRKCCKRNQTATEWEKTCFALLAILITLVCPNGGQQKLH